MQIKEKNVVSMHYTLKDDTGSVIDSSDGKDPLTFIFGSGMIIPGLEKAIDGKIVGDKLDVTVSPEEGYGVFDDKRIFTVPRENFAPDADIQEGMQVQASDPNGGVFVLVVKKIDGDQITLDGNHPLAGETLHFSVSIEDIREATAEEIEHGHVH